MEYISFDCLESMQIIIKRVIKITCKKLLIRKIFLKFCIKHNEQNINPGNDKLILHIINFTKYKIQYIF